MAGLLLILYILLYNNSIDKSTVQSSWDISLELPNSIPTKNKLTFEAVFSSYIRRYLIISKEFRGIAGIPMFRRIKVGRYS